MNPENGDKNGLNMFCYPSPFDGLLYIDIIFFGGGGARGGKRMGSQKDPAPPPLCHQSGGVPM